LNWLTLSGFLDVPRKELVLASGKLPARALVGATHTISLQSLSAQGVVLLGRFRGVGTPSREAGSCKRAQSCHARDDGWNANSIQEAEIIAARTVKCNMHCFTAGF